MHNELFQANQVVFTNSWTIEQYGTCIVMLLEYMKNEMVLMNSWSIEHYGASFGDDIDAKMNYFKWLFNVY